jgi:protein Tex
VGHGEGRKDSDAQDEKRVYELYYDFEQRVDRLRPHQVLAINRGEEEKVLRVKVGVMERDWQEAVYMNFRPTGARRFFDQLNLAAADAPSACCCRPSSATCAAR